MRAASPDGNSPSCSFGYNSQNLFPLIVAQGWSFCSSSTSHQPVNTALHLPLHECAERPLIKAAILVERCYQCRAATCWYFHHALSLQLLRAEANGVAS